MHKMVIYNNICTINSQINGTPKGVYLPISKLRVKSSVSSKWASINTYGVPFILLLMVHRKRKRTLITENIT